MKRKAPKKIKLKERDWSKLTKARVVLIFGTNMVSGDGMFTAFKTLPRGGEAVFNITLVKKL